MSEPTRSLDPHLIKQAADNIRALHGLNFDDHRFTLLTRAFGERNVEEALIFIARACDGQNKRVIIRPTFEMIRATLEAVHGRTGVGEVRLNGTSGEVRPTV